MEGDPVGQRAPAGDAAGEKPFGRVEGVDGGVGEPVPIHVGEGGEDLPDEEEGAGRGEGEDGKDAGKPDATAVAPDQHRAGDQEIDERSARVGEYERGEKDAAARE